MVKFTGCSSCKEVHTRVSNPLEYSTRLADARSGHDPLNISGLGYSGLVQNTPSGGRDGPGNGIA